MFLAPQFAFFLWALPTQCATTSYTALAIRQGIQDYTNSMSIGASGFLDMVKNSKIFVDTSLFIKEIIENEFKSKLILAPRKLGKTTNLLMLKAFLEPELHDINHTMKRREDSANYKLFVNGEVTLDNGRVEKLQSPLLISKYPVICDKYLGKHPVVYISFKDVIGDNYTEIINRINIAVSKAFCEHKYMISILERAGKTSAVKNFKNLLYGENEADYKSGAKFLLETLKEYYGFNPFLIVEDYDVPLYNIFRIQSYKKTSIGDLMDYIHTILAFAVKITYIADQDITSACFEIGHNTIIPWLSQRFKRINIVERYEPIQKYFGFSQTIVQELYRLHNISEPLITLANKWYRAHIYKRSQESYYHPSSIVSFLHYRRIDTYWEDNCIIDAIDVLIARSLYVRRALLMMLGNHGHIMKSQSYFNKRQLNYLQDSFRGRPTYNAGFLALSYLIDLGYLARNQGQDSSNFTRFANDEMACIFAKSMIWYYKKCYKLDTELSHDAAVSFLNFISGDYVDTSNPMIYDIQQSMKQLYVRSGQTHLQSNTSTHTYAMLNCVMLQILCMTKLQLNIHFVNALGPDFTVYDDITKTATIIQFETHQPSAQRAFNTALAFEGILKYEGFQNVTAARFIGINIAPNASVQILATTKDIRPISLSNL